jgi:VWFA-related protein
MPLGKIAQIAGVIFATAGLVHAQQPSAGNPASPPAGAATAAGSSATATLGALAPQSPNNGTPTLRSEARVVRVDVIVTDKKGNYIHDLAASDFHVFDNGKEQKVINFSTGRAEATSGGGDRHYMVLFFDDSTMDMGDQQRARQAAVKFIDANAGPDRVMAVVDFTGTLRILQNFSGDPAKIKKATEFAKTSAVSPYSSDSDSTPGATSPTRTTGPSLFDTQNDFGVYTLLLGIRGLARDLTDVPGRKSVILFTSGFPLTPEADAELTATISECNKANVAVYPLDVRGLIAPAPTGSGTMLLPDARTKDRTLAASIGEPAGSAGGRPKLVLAAYRSPDPAAAEPQHGGGGAPVGGGGGGGGRPGGAPIGGSGPPTSGGGHPGGSGSGPTSPSAPSGGHPTGGGPAPAPYTYGYPYPGSAGVTPQMIVPQLPDTGVGNQGVLYALAEGTGGFPILNSNDLLGGLVKIANEQNEYYLLGYAPLDAPDGSCHTLKVRVEHGLQVRARTGYCTAKPSDILAGKPIEKDLEAHASGSAASAMSGSIEAPFFYTSPNEARVNVSLEIPSSSVGFSKEKGKYRADVNILGIAYRPDGSVGARFSDQVTLDLEKDAWKQFTASPMRYQNQFEVAPGKYRLDVVLSAGGQNFGKYETTLDIDPYNGRTFTLSGLALSDHIERAGLGEAVQAALLQDQTPLITKDVEIVPSGSNRFKKTELVALYAQVYDPSLAGPNPPAVRVAFRVVDTKTNHEVIPTEAIDASEFVEKGNPVVPLGLKLPIANLPSGSYRLDMQAYDMSGTLSKVRSVEFAEE